MGNIRVLLVGESWISQGTHIKGFDYFSSSAYETGHFYLQAALDKAGKFELEHMPSHIAAEAFPESLDDLRKYDVIIFSDIGSNTLLLSRKVFVEGKTAPNRLRIVKEWVEEGGGFCMCGGYLSFGGFQGTAKYHKTPIEEILPVSIYPYDDRIEVPEGTRGIVVDPGHPTVAGINEEWPYLLGFQEAVLKEDARLIVRTDSGYPLLAVRQHGKGRTLVWMTDIGPHWCPKEFATWNGYQQLWKQSLQWLANT